MESAQEFGAPANATMRDPNAWYNTGRGAREETKVDRNRPMLTARGDYSSNSLSSGASVGLENSMQ